jgi:hypothetical protein
MRAPSKHNWPAIDILAIRLYSRGGSRSSQDCGGLAACAAALGCAVVRRCRPSSHEREIQAGHENLPGRDIFAPPSSRAERTASASIANASAAPVRVSSVAAIVSGSATEPAPADSVYDREKGDAPNMKLFEQSY